MTDIAGTATGSSSATGDFRALHDIVEPVSSTTILSELSRAQPEYANALAAYSAWCSESGVSSTGSDYSPTGLGDYWEPIWLDLGFALVKGGSSSIIFIGKGSGIHVFYSDPDAYTASDIDMPGGLVDGTRWDGRVPLYKGCFSIGIDRDQPGAFTDGVVTDFRVRNLLNSPTTPHAEVIGYYVHNSDGGGSNWEATEFAFRIRQGFLELYISHPASYTPSAGNNVIQYQIANESTDTLVSGRQLGPSVNAPSAVFRVVTANDLGIDLNTLTDTLSETTSVDAGEQVNGIYGLPLTGNLLLSGGVAVGLVAALSETTTQTPDADYVFKPGAAVAEVISAQDVITRNFIYATGVFQNFRVTELLRAAYLADAVENLTVSELSDVVRGLVVLEALQVTSPALAQATYQKLVAQSLMMSDVLRRFFGGDVSESISYADALSATAKLPAAIADALSVDGAVTCNLLFSVQAAETVDIESVDVLQSIWSGSVSEDIRIAAAHISPDGGFTTWAVNTLTGTTTEYTNFAFNSFATMGHKMLGATSSGLYELNGDTDDGANIIAKIRSGYMQFGGSKFSSLSAAYLGIRGDGTFLLRIRTGDDKVYTYQVNAHSLRTTKINIGKGIRSRYLSYELESAGDDFDLDNIEFIPLVARRRV